MPNGAGEGEQRMWVRRGRCRTRGHCSHLLAGNERHSKTTQKATVSSTCLLWSQWPRLMASEAEPGSGTPQGGKASTWRYTRVLKEALVLSGGREGRCPQVPFSAPNGLLPLLLLPSSPQPPHPPQPPSTQLRADGCKFCRGLCAFPWRRATFQRSICFISSPQGLPFQVEPKRKAWLRLHIS